MKIAVFSDSHEDVHTMGEIVRIVNPDMVIHLGDHVADAEVLQKWFPDIPFEMVKGNTDDETRHPSEKLIEIGDIRVFITHGDAYDAVLTRAVVDKALESNVQIVLHGHTHVAAISFEHGTVVMNPGSIRRFSTKSIASFGIIEIDGDDFSCRVLSASQLIN